MALKIVGKNGFKLSKTLSTSAVTELVIMIKDKRRSFFILKIQD